MRRLADAVYDFFADPWNLAGDALLVAVLMVGFIAITAGVHRA